MKNHKKRIVPLYALIAIILLAGIGMLAALLTIHRPERERSSFADYIISDYEGGFDFRFIFKDEYKLTAEGLNGGNSRMMQVYSNGDVEIAFSYSALTATQNQLAGQMGLELEKWAVDPSLGEAALTAYIKNAETGGYYEVFAEGRGLTAVELAKLTDWHVYISTPWDRHYRPTLSASGWYKVIDWDSEWTGTGEWEGCGEALRKGLYDIINGCEWECTYIESFSIDYQALYWFTWRSGDTLCSLDVLGDGHIFYYERRPDPDKPDTYSWYYGANYSPVSGREGKKLAEEVTALVSRLPGRA